MLRTTASSNRLEDPCYEILRSEGRGHQSVDATEINFSALPWSRGCVRAQISRWQSQNYRILYFADAIVTDRHFPPPTVSVEGQQLSTHFNILIVEDRGMSLS
jgi:hypothetical protein